jgi:uncharacterized membrane-anchored protein
MAAHPASNDHPLRVSLHEEVHARPPVPLWPNERVISQAFLTDPDSRQAQKEWIDRAAAVLKTESAAMHGQSIWLLTLSSAPSQILLKWELHGEFVAITLFVQQPEGKAAERSDILKHINGLLAQVNLAPIESAGGQRLAALDLLLERGNLFQDASEVALRFDGHTVLGSTILTSQIAQLWTDLQLDHDGFVRALIRHEGIGSRQAGRAVQRLIDVDTYRMMALLALPNAKALAEPLRRAELELSELSNQIASAQQVDSVDLNLDASLLQGVSVLAARVEDWISANGLRFTAAEAYHELVRRSLTELHETTIPGVQMLNTFMERRFEPAMRTCSWTVRRLHDLSDRVSRTTQILRTRIEYANESQTQALLASMDRRAKLQLRLQQTVEGLSVIVLTYYATGLIHYVAKGAQDLGLGIAPDIVALIAVPVIAGGLLWFMRQRRKKQPLI